MSEHDPLLQPTLASSLERKVPYSVTTTFYTAFFGGPVAAALILCTNAHRLRRLAADARWIVPLLVALLAGLMYGWTKATAIQQALGSRNLSWMTSLFGLALYAGGYRLHREEQRATDLAGLKRPNGLWPGLLCVVVGLILTVALLVPVELLRRG